MFFFFHSALVDTSFLFQHLYRSARTDLQAYVNLRAQLYFSQLQFLFDYAQIDAHVIILVDFLFNISFLIFYLRSSLYSE